MKLTIFLAYITTINAKVTENLADEESKFWSRELQNSLFGSGGNPNESLPCGLSTKDRRTSILATLRGSVSNAALLNTPGTPQNSAAEWLIGTDELYVCPDDNKCTVIQRYVMGLFYYTTVGDSWTQCSQNDDTCANPFLSSVDECDWFGITCNNDQCVTEITFESNNVEGFIPPELEQLDNLEVLSLEQGGLARSIPSNLGTLSNLRILDLDFNQITGSIPEEIYSLTSLQQLDLNTNKLIGTISTSIGNLVVLRLLQLYENLMTGTIPAELGSASSLVIAEFFNNTFTGEMPAAVCQNRAPPTGTGAITGLTSDCFPFPIAQIECSCCTGCAVY